MKFSRYTLFGIIAIALLVFVAAVELHKHKTYALLRENHVEVEVWGGGINRFLEFPNSSWFAYPVHVRVNDTSGDVDVISDCLKNSKTIQAVSYYRCERLDSSKLDLLLHLPNLVVLNVMNCQLDDDAWRVIASLPKLKYLKIESTEISDEQLKLLKFNNLKRLSFISESFTLEGIRGLVPMSIATLDLVTMRHFGKQHLAEVEALFPHTKIFISDQ